MEVIRNRLNALNTPQLEKEIRAAFGERYRGLSADQLTVRLFMDDDLTKGDIESLETIYETHKPTETDEQESERKRSAREERLLLLRKFDKLAIKSLDDALPYLEALISLVVGD